MSSSLTEQQAQWREIVKDPSLHDLPYKVETNARGQLVLSPHKHGHSQLQSRLFRLLRRHAPEGLVSVKYALATPVGVKAPDVVWMSPEREREMAKTGDPSTLAPELCVEVTRASGTEAELGEKRTLYRDIGAEEVWIVSEEKEIRMFDTARRTSSRIAPSCPAAVNVE